MFLPTVSALWSEMMRVFAGVRSGGNAASAASSCVCVCHPVLRISTMSSPRYVGSELIQRAGDVAGAGICPAARHSATRSSTVCRCSSFQSEVVM